MQSDEAQLPRPCLSDLDAALNELGMLATRSKSRDEYLSEIQNKNYLNMLTINTRYVSNVSIGFRVRPVAPHVRYNPYRMPKERHRTRSENNDSEAVKLIGSIVDDCVAQTVNGSDDLNQLKKAKSLESIMAENQSDSSDYENFRNTISIKDSSNDLEVVSDSIQNLKVDE